jgi:hypothetical protein
MPAKKVVPASFAAAHCRMGCVWPLFGLNQLNMAGLGAFEHPKWLKSTKIRINHYI